MNNLIKCIDDELLQGLSILANYRKELAVKNASLHSGLSKCLSLFTLSPRVTSSHVISLQCV